MRPVGGLAVGGPVRTFLSDFFLGFKKKYHMKNFMNKPLTSNL